MTVEALQDFRALRANAGAQPSVLCRATAHPATGARAFDLPGHPAKDAEDED